MAKPTPPFKEILFFSHRMDIKNAVRDAVKKYSFESIHFDAPNDITEVIEKTTSSDRSVLILDWEYGHNEIIEILETAAQSLKVETRAIILIANEMTKKLLSISSEYHVSKVHTGDISIQKLIELMDQIGKDEKTNGPLRSIISEVNKNRSEDNWSKASEILENLQAKIPDNPQIICELATNYMNEESWDKALSILEPLEDLDPPHIRSLHLLSKCRLKIGDFEDASKSLEKAKMINPFNVDRLILLGNVLVECDKIADAKANFDEAKRLDPNNTAATQGQGQCLLLEGEVNEALSLLKDIESPSELASVFNSSAVLCIRRGEYDKGMDLYETALKTIKDNKKVQSRLIFNKGLGYRRLKKEDLAMNCLEEAVKLDPDFEKAKKHFAIIAKKLKAKIPEHMNLSKNEIEIDLMETDFDFSFSDSFNEYDVSDVDEDDSTDIF